MRPQEHVYGYGGYLVAATSGSTLTRDRVAAVYKLSMTGRRATMKFGNEAGAENRGVPGRPVVFRRQAGASGPVGIVGQEGEAAPGGYALLTGSERPFTLEEAQRVAPADQRLELSEQTKALTEQLSKAAFP